MRYVRRNGVDHSVVAKPEDDTFASHGGSITLPAPHTWLLREGWQRAARRARQNTFVR